MFTSGLIHSKNQQRKGKNQTMNLLFSIQTAFEGIKSPMTRFVCPFKAFQLRNADVLENHHFAMSHKMTPVGDDPLEEGTMGFGGGGAVSCLEPRTLWKSTWGLSGLRRRGTEVPVTPHPEVEAGDSSSAGGNTQPQVPRFAPHLSPQAQGSDRGTVHGDLVFVPGSWPRARAAPFISRDKSLSIILSVW